MALIENIYFSISVDGNKDRYKNYFKSLLEPQFEKLKIASLKEEVFVFDGCEVIGGIQRYPYGFRFTDKFRLYFASNFGDNYPIYCIVDAIFLHMNSVEYVLSEVEIMLKRLYKHFDESFVFFDYKRKLSRVDICNHNTFIDLDTYITLNEYNSRVVTKIRNVRPYIELKGDNDYEVPYFRYSGEDWAVRFYNKTKEVVEQQYKHWFFLKWLDYGLIDKNTFNIYENVFRLNKNYRIDFIYSHLFYYKYKIENDDFKVIADTYNNIKIDNDEKYDIFKFYLKKYKIKMCKEVVNVEFQLNSGFLRTLKIIDEVTGEYIDFTCIDSLVKNLNKLYEHLTLHSFRVVSSDSRAFRKRDKKTDLLWQQIQNSKIINIDVCDNKKLIYRDYVNKMNKDITVRDTVIKLSHLAYLCLDCLNVECVDDISIDYICDILKSEYIMNENYYNLKERLMKQIMLYGEKKK